MSFLFFKRHKNKKQYDWIEKYLDDSNQVQASPFLWTRIKVQLDNNEFVKNRFSIWDNRFHILMKWMQPAFFVISISFAIIVGKQLSSEFHHYFHPGHSHEYQLQFENSIHSDMDEYPDDLLLFPFQEEKEERGE